MKCPTYPVSTALLVILCEKGVGHRVNWSTLTQLILLVGWNIHQDFAQIPAHNAVLGPTLGIDSHELVFKSIQDPTVVKCKSYSPGISRPRPLGTPSGIRFWNLLVSVRAWFSPLQILLLIAASGTSRFVSATISRPILMTSSG